MNEPGRTLFVVAVGAWIGILALAIGGTRLLFHRLGRDGAWNSFRLLAPLADLLGTWCGTIAAGGLFLGRRGYTWQWAVALGLVALTITASLYDRAVLMPSLDAAHRRLAAGDDAARWEGDWRFLWRMAAWGRGLSLAALLGALAASAA